MKVFKEISADTVTSSQISASAATESQASAATGVQRLVAADAGGTLSIYDTIKGIFK
jgi:hypothetical protein